MKSLALLATLLLFNSCAPLAESIPKSKLCEIPSEWQSKYDSVQIGDSWNQVQLTMGETPTIDGDTQIYKHCKEMVFTFYGSALVSKDIK